MSQINEKYTYIDLFSGCGGLALGMHLAGWKAHFAVEKNQDAFRTLKFNLIDRIPHFCWPDWLPEGPQDINDLIDSNEEQLLALSGKVTLVTGGPPCQGFSMAGRRKEDDKRNSLIDSYLRFIDLVDPDSLLFENVKGFTQPFNNCAADNKGKNYSVYIVEELERRGYAVESRMIDFSKYGVPQRRMRFILFASKTINPKDLFRTLKHNRCDFFRKKDLTPTVSLKAAISDLLKGNGQQPCPDSKRFMAGVYGNSRTKYQRYCRGNAERGIVPDSHRFANHRDTTVARFQELLKNDVRNQNISDILKEKYGVRKNCFSVLDANIPSPTLTSNPDDHIHYSEPRTLTVREYARVQSFPDWYEFKGKYTTGGDLRRIEVPRYTQIANAIPPLFAEQVGLALKQLLTNQDEEH